MFDPISLGHFAHLKANVPGFRPIIDVGKKMAVNIDHPLDDNVAANLLPFGSGM